jgi:hypothetical protein
VRRQPKASLPKTKKQLTLGVTALLPGVDLLLDLERLGLEAEVSDLELVVAVDADLAVGSGELSATVGKTSALHLLVCEGADLVGGDGIGSLGSEEEGDSDKAGDGSLVHLHGACCLGRLLVRNKKHKNNSPSVTFKRQNTNHPEYGHNS